MHKSGAALTLMSYGQHNSVGTEVGRWRCACWSFTGQQHGMRYAAGPSAHGTQGSQGSQKQKRQRSSMDVPPGRWHPLNPAPRQAFCSAARETSFSKIFVLWSFSCPASRVPCGTSPSQESSDPKAKGSGTCASEQSQKAAVQHSFGRAVTLQWQSHMDLGG